ncbi:hypothetical protein E1A91_D01G124500v1 [Gossypium mustelinum]|uniref:Small ribosomal subunit protein uS17 N-terminal domain-containing protein n=4 Tax=Gossypium TaxID=3633 RepID=A0A5D2W5U5_GOSMU|nr:hypothetical protein E1A91_D01G124500v1 [Gossypium mustelinum]TYI97167.1 hypothetical protein E1A91_D01G124500v1 [Gossypium mustelinum]TYI97168.1 hypothetical protein E1A91_D01G124500v1 [Gossypium mustelinum]TYI97169.1 hypothetical protein E1A91_D01G124500v1 [Gossypium mustelinum]TYI97174.1 hypothetical protein E1A91_D01G124500v1 [Gossypium mustelinum]
MRLLKVLFQIHMVILVCRMSSITSDGQNKYCKKTGKGKRPGKGGNRFWKSIGLGFKTPREAIEDFQQHDPKMAVENQNCQAN